MKKNEDTNALAQEALRQLMILPRISWLSRGKRFARKYVLHQLVEPIDYIPWPKGCLLVGLVRAGWHEEAAAYFDLWIKKGAKLYTVDNLLAGQALLLLTDACEREREQDGRDTPYSSRRLYRYETKAHAMMGFLYAHEKDGQGSLPYRPLHKTGHIYADGIGMICPFAIGYGMKYHDKEAVKLAMRQFRSFLQNGMDQRTGLPYHAYRYQGDSEPEKLGTLGWGRAAGWIFYGLGMSLRFLEADPTRFSKEREELLCMAERLADTVLSYRNAEGLFGAELPDASSPTDTSGTAMILHGISMLKGEKYHAAYEEMVRALQNYCRDGKVLQAQSECIGLGEYGRQYDSYPWSVGMTLSLLVLS